MKKKNKLTLSFLANKYGIKPEDILLVHDELDKPLGKVAVKHGGSARCVGVCQCQNLLPVRETFKLSFCSHRGHNGVRSCVDCLQTDVS